MIKSLSLSRLLRDRKAMSSVEGRDFEEGIQELQFQMLKIQQGIWHQKSRAIILFEGFDAAGKGGAIRRLTEHLDQRGVRVYPIGPPTSEELNRHWLQRFWKRIPERGSIAIFDRSWYGRVLVERVEKLTERADWKRAYAEINEFEKMLEDDGIEIVKIFLAISKDEQLRRFEDRLKDPYKQWKLTMDDLRARKSWDDYVEAVDQMFKETSTKSAPWNLIAANDKRHARREVLKVVTSKLKLSEAWMENKAARLGRRTLAEALKELGRNKKDL